VRAVGQVLALLLHVGDEAYAVACKDVVTVAPRPALRAVPGVPKDVLGVFVFRGGIVPIVDLSIRLGAGPTPDRLSSRVVLIKPGERIVGVLAAQVSDVVRIARDEGHAPMASEPAVASAVLHQGRTVLWLELRALAPEGVLALLDGAP
jgi:chemotaxis-related protein WspB